MDSVFTTTQLRIPRPCKTPYAGKLSRGGRVTIDPVTISTRGAIVKLEAVHREARRVGGREKMKGMTSPENPVPQSETLASPESTLLGLLQVARQTLNVAAQGCRGRIGARYERRLRFDVLPKRRESVAVRVLAARGGDGAGLGGVGRAVAGLRVLVLSGARSAEARLASWDEIDPHARKWKMPAARTKAGREHRVRCAGGIRAAFRLPQTPKEALLDAIGVATRRGS